MKPFVLTLLLVLVASLESSGDDSVATAIIASPTESTTTETSTTNANATDAAPPSAHETETTTTERVPPSREPFVLAGVEIAAGTEKDLLLLSSESFSGGEVKLPIVVIHGTKPGPVLCLTSGIHGDELNGIEIVREVLETHQAEGLAGTIIGIPIMNLFGFWNQSRYLPDRRDLNRHFPGRPAGSTASRIAHKVWTEVIVRCTHLVDFHTGSLHRANLPQIRADLRKPVIQKFAHAFGAEVTVHNPGQKGTLRFEAANFGIPAILYEAGETMRFQRREIRNGVLGVQNLMITLGMRDGQTVAPGPKNTFVETHWVRAQQGGIAEIYPSLGEWVQKGDVVGIVTDPLRRAKGVVVAPWTGRVIGKVLAPTVLPGLAVLHIGVPDGKMERSEAATEELDQDRPE